MLLQFYVSPRPRPPVLLAYYRKQILLQQPVQLLLYHNCKFLWLPYTNLPLPGQASQDLATSVAPTHKSSASGTGPSGPRYFNGLHTQIFRSQDRPLATSVAPRHKSSAPGTSLSGPRYFHDSHTQIFRSRDRPVTTSQLLWLPYTNLPLRGQASQDLVLWLPCTNLPQVKSVRLDVFDCFPLLLLPSLAPKSGSSIWLRMGGDRLTHIFSQMIFQFGRRRGRGPEARRGPQAPRRALEARRGRIQPLWQSAGQSSRLWGRCSCCESSTRTVGTSHTDPIHWHALVHSEVHLCW